MNSLSERYGHFFFDLDGTLIDSFEDIRLSFDQSCRKVLGKEGGLTRDKIGPPLADMIDIVFPGMDAVLKDALTKEFRSIYDSSDYKNTLEITGAVRVLKNLHDKGRSVYIVTNKAYLPTTRILAKLGIDFAKDIVAPNKFEGKKMSKTELIAYLLDKYSISKKDVVMIGDTSSDVKAAKNNGIDSIAVTQGYESAESLAALQPTLIVDDIRQLNEQILINNNL